MPAAEARDIIHRGGVPKTAVQPPDIDFLGSSGRPSRRATGEARFPKPLYCQYIANLPSSAAAAGVSHGSQNCCTVLAGSCQREPWRRHRFWNYCTAGRSLSSAAVTDKLHVFLMFRLACQPCAPTTDRCPVCQTRQNRGNCSNHTILINCCFWVGLVLASKTRWWTGA